MTYKPQGWTEVWHFRKVNDLQTSDQEIYTANRLGSTTTRQRKWPADRIFHPQSSPFQSYKNLHPPQHRHTVPVLQRDSGPSVALETPVGFLSSPRCLQPLPNREYRENKILPPAYSGWVRLSAISRELSRCDVWPHVGYWSPWSHQTTALGRNSTCL